MKRGINGVYHHVSPQHLEGYLAEFGFRYDSRKIEDDMRAMVAIDQARGKRLMYREPCGVE